MTSMCRETGLSTPIRLTGTAADGPSRRLGCLKCGKQHRPLDSVLQPLQRGTSMQRQGCYIIYDNANAVIHMGLYS